jgi:hypothetical protein
VTVDVDLTGLTEIKTRNCDVSRTKVTWNDGNGVFPEKRAPERDADVAVSVTLVWRSGGYTECVFVFNPLLVSSARRYP